MPIKKSALSELKKSKKRHQRNMKIVSELKTLIKRFRKLLSLKDLDGAKKIVPTIVGKIDRACSKGVIHKNIASRKKSRLMRKLNLNSKNP